MLTIRIARPRRLYGALFAFTIRLDDQEVGKIRRGGQLEVSGVAGQQTISVHQGSRRLAQRLITLDAQAESRDFLIVATRNPLRLLRSLLPSDGAGFVEIQVAPN